MVYLNPLDFSPNVCGQTAMVTHFAAQNIHLALFQVPAGAGEGSGGTAVDLSTGLTGEALQPLLQNQEFLDKVKEFLPAGEEGKEVTLSDLSGTVQSPQFQQAVSMFSMALSSGKD